MSNMQIEVGKWYKTSKDNYKAFITTHLDKSVACSMPYLGYVTTNDGIFWIQACFNENGKCNHTTFHLIEEWKEPKSGIGYLHVYIDDGEIEYRFRDNNNNLENLANAIVRVEWNEGQFDD